MDRTKTLKQIEKLLALSTSPNEHEAQLAMQRAKQLLFKLNLKEFPKHETLVDEIEVIPITCKVSCTGASIYFLHIATTIGKIFNCTTVSNETGYVAFVGFPSAIKIATYATDSILAQGQADFRKGYRKKRSLVFSNSFWYGYMKAIRKKFTKEAEQVKEGIILYDAVAKYCERFGSRPTIIIRDESCGYSAGTKSGEQAEIRPGINVQNGGKLLP